MKTKERILLESKAWRQEKISLDSNYFDRISGLHHPQVLWIASSDNLVSMREMTNMEPGSIVVYRNIGSQVREDDVSLAAVVEDAVINHDIKHLIVCGYSNCSGIRDVIEGRDTTPALKEWLKHLRKLYEDNYSLVKDRPFEQQARILSELNIRQQVLNLSQMECIQRSWERRDYPRIFGWYFDLKSGLLQEVFSLEENHRLKQTSRLAEV